MNFGVPAFVLLKAISSGEPIGDARRRGDHGQPAGRSHFHVHRAHVMAVARRCCR